MTASRQKAASRAAPARRTGSSYGSAGDDGVIDPFSLLASFLMRVETLGLILTILAVVIPPAMVLGPPITEPLLAPVARTLGAGVLLVAPWPALFGVLVVRRRLLFTRPAVYKLLGWALFVFVVWGAMGWFSPDWRLSGVRLDGVSLGGRVGAAIGLTWYGLLAWIGCLVASSLILWPRLTFAVAGAVPPLARMVWNWHVPERIGRTAVEGMKALFPTGEGRPELEDELPLDDDTVLSVAAPARPAPRPRPGPARVAAAPVVDVPASEPEPAPLPPDGNWPRPPRDLLAAPVPPEVAAKENDLRAQLIVDTLGSFGVDARVVSVSQGPTVTQFGIEPGWEVKTKSVPERDAAGRAVLDRDGRPKVRVEEVSRTRVRVNEVTRLANDLALALAAPSIRIEAPVPGKPVIGIEVPNSNAAVVNLRQVLETPAFAKVGARSKLALALGQGVSGDVVVADLAKMPHLLIAGATGAGKSVCINSIIASILMHASPAEVRFVLIDPKRVEMAGYEPLPHLAFSRVIVEMDEVVGTLGAVIHEMDARYRKFAALAVRNLEAYNKHPNVVERLPQWVVIVDELADLMMTAGFEVEKQICRLAQLARATGIHLVIATQRPSVDVITGLIKANFPTRIAFAVSSQVDSRTILDSGGAEKLLGRGDMLYLATDAAKPRRIQGVYVSDQEIERLVEFWANERFAPYRPPKFDDLLEQAKAETDRAEEDEDDPLLERARELAAEHSRISTSMLQRRLRIGYPRAARMMDILESEGLVGGAEGGGSRPVFGDGSEAF